MISASNAAESIVPSADDPSARAAGFAVEAGPGG
jgi:hypothetical protein